MNTKHFIAILLLIAGALSLAYGGFDYTKATHQANVGPVHLSVDEENHVSVPLWAGFCALVLGALLLIPSKKN